MVKILNAILHADAKITQELLSCHTNIKLFQARSNICTSHADIQHAIDPGTMQGQIIAETGCSCNWSNTGNKDFHLMNCCKKLLQGFYFIFSGNCNKEHVYTS